MIVTVTEVIDGVSVESSGVTVEVTEGTVGADGASAYEIAVDNGFVGTEAEWLASLQGEDGAGVVGSVVAPLVLTGDVLSLDVGTTGGVADYDATTTALAGKASTATTDALDGRLDTLEAVDNATQAELDAHATDTTAVHGIADTAALETTTGSQAKADAAQAAAVQRANHTGTQSADTLTDGTTNKAFLATERTKLAGIATGATANDTDANLKARANHTGTQTASTISDFSESVDDRVDALVTDGSGIETTYDDSGGTLTIARGAVTVNAQTGTSYTLVLADKAKFVTLSNASAVTFTVPPNSSVAFPVGTLIEGAQLGAGQVTITPGSGVTVNATPGLKVAAQYGTFGLLKTATDVWLAYGRLSA